MEFALDTIWMFANIYIHIYVLAYNIFSRIFYSFLLNTKKYSNWRRNEAYFFHFVMKYLSTENWNLFPMIWMIAHTQTHIFWCLFHWDDKLYTFNFLEMYWMNCFFFPLSISINIFFCWVRKLYSIELVWLCCINLNWLKIVCLWNLSRN